MAPQRIGARRLVGAAAGIAVTMAGCDAILGLGDEPTEGLTSGTGGGAATSSSGANTGTDAASTGEGGAPTGSSSQSGAGAGEPASTAMASGVGGGSGGSGGAGGSGPVCADADPGAFTCGPCDGKCEGFCSRDGTRCLKRVVRVKNTARVVEDDVDPTSIFNRYGRGLAVGGGSIAFTRAAPNIQPPTKSVLTVVTMPDDGDEEASITDIDFNKASLYAIAGDPTGEYIAVTEVTNSGKPDAFRLVLDPVGKDKPRLDPLGPAIPSESFAAMAWQSGSRFAAAGRNGAVLYTFDMANSQATCPVGLPQEGGAGVAVAHGQLGGEPTVVAPHFDSDLIRVEVDPAVDECPMNGPMATESVLGGRDVDATHGVALGCDHVYVQARLGANGRAVRVDNEAEQATYPSQAIAAHGDRVYLPIFAGGVRLCAGDLAESSCSTVLGAPEAGFVSLLAATRDGFVSVGLANPDLETSDTIVACVDHLAD